ncbi:unnamed protein product [Urochloa humidicola]
MRAGRAKKADAAPLGSSVFVHADAVDVALMVLGVLSAIGDGMATPLRLLIASRIANDLGSGPEHIHQFTSKINANAIRIVLIACAAWVMAFLEGYCWARTAERQASRMQARYLQAVLRQDVEYFDLKAGSTSDVVASVSNDSLVVQDALAEKLPNFVTYVTMFTGCYAVGFALLWRLTLVSLPSALLLIVPGVAYGRALTDLARRIRAQYARPGAVAEQAVSSARTVYSFVAEKPTMARFAAALEESARLGIRQGLAKGVAVGSNGIAFAIYAFNIWYGSRLVMHHGYPGGTVFVVSSLIVIGGVSLGSALSNVKYFSEATAAADRILEMIRRVPKIDSESDAGEELAGGVAGEVEFRNVEFCYPSRPECPVLVSFSLQVPAGRTVALVGHSGSGKSTAIALLERFYDPSAGTVALDGVDIRRLRLKWLRAQMGLVSQEPAMFAMSVRENILFGEEDAMDEEVIAAAKAANAHNFISQLPQGYDTQVGERGAQMSGGQKQRIAIARAILRSPKILLLDEATSALDTESERIVQEALDVASKGRTTIIVAHRLPTIRNADSIAVVQYGAVQELGSHSELIAKNGMYSSLVHLQQTRDSSEGNGVGENCHLSPSIGQCSSNTGKMLSSASRSSWTLSIGDARDGDSSEKTKLPVPSLGRMLLLNAPEWKYAVVGGLSAILTGGIQPIYAYCMGCTFSIYYSTDHGEIKEKIRLYALVFLALVVISFLLNIGQHYSFGAMGEYLTKRIRERMLEKILTFEIGWFDQDENSSGAICSQLAKDANIVRSLVGDRIALVIQTVSMVFIAFTVVSSFLGAWPSS